MISHSHVYLEKEYVVYFKDGQKSDPLAKSKIFSFEEDAERKTHRIVDGPQLFVLSIGFATSERGIQNMLDKQKITSKHVTETEFENFHVHNNWIHFERCGLFANS
jgi:hypothetical protein